MASEEIIFFHLMYILFTYCALYPPQEFLNVGLSVDKICAALVTFPPEQTQFVQFHKYRTTANQLFHSILPLLYFGVYDLYFTDLVGHQPHWLVAACWSCIRWASVLGPLALAASTVYKWKSDRHPLMVEMAKYCVQGQSWPDVAASINTEYRSVQKKISKVSTIVSVIATENWIIKTTPYEVRIAHQSDTALILVKRHASHQPRLVEAIQFVNIVVKPTRPKVRKFAIRLNALDFTDLQDRLHRPITILNGVNFKRSVLEHFIETFKELVALNGTYDTDQELDSCFACMIAAPDIKLQKRCADVDAAGAPLPTEQRCGNCFCRPMWCVECMAKWFASKQNENEKDVWLEQKCSCPMCRTTFCMLDVCQVNRV